MKRFEIQKVEIEDVQAFARKVGDFFEKVGDLFQKVGVSLEKARRFGRPKSSWRNKARWANPRPEFLAKGLEWPPDRFESEEHRRRYYREARKRPPRLFGSPPTWTILMLNFVVLAVVIRREFNVSS